MRQLFTQSQHLSTVITRRCLQAPDWTRPWTPPTMVQTFVREPMGGVQLNHAWY